MVKRLMLSLAALAFGVALVAPAPAFARMHFTTTNERLDALTQQANSSVSLTNQAEIATKLNEITTQAQGAKAAAEEAAQRPASVAEDKSVLAKVGTDMDAVVAAANKAKTATGADQQASLKEIQTRAQDSSNAVKQRIAAQRRSPAGPGWRRRARPSCRLRPGERAWRGPGPARARTVLCGWRPRRPGRCPTAPFGLIRWPSPPTPLPVRGRGEQSPACRSSPLSSQEGAGGPWGYKDVGVADIRAAQRPMVG